MQSPSKMSHPTRHSTRDVRRERGPLQNSHRQYFSSRQHNLGAVHHRPNCDIPDTNVRGECSPVHYNGGNSGTSTGCFVAQDAEEIILPGRPTGNHAQQGKDGALERQFGTMLPMDESTQAEARTKCRELRKVARAKVQENIHLSQRGMGRLREISELERQLEMMKKTTSSAE